jgi:hypothetical protein
MCFCIGYCLKEQFNFEGNKMSIRDLLKEVEEVSKEVSQDDLKSGGSGSFINAGGVYPTTIEKAFMTETDKGGIKLDLMFGGANKIDIELYIISKKNGKLITTCQSGGKTVTLKSYKMFVQLYYILVGKAPKLSELNLKEETIKYKKFGKDITVEADTLVDLIGKEVNIGIRLEEQYAYEDGVTIESRLKTNQNGDTLYKKELEYVFSKDGLSAQEIAKGVTEGTEMESKDKFLKGDKGIKRVKLEAPEIEEDDEEVQF